MEWHSLIAVRCELTVQCHQPNNVVIIIFTAVLLLKFKGGRKNLKCAGD